MSRFNVILVFSVLILFQSVSLSQPAHYPSEFALVGQLEQLNAKERIAVVNGQPMRIGLGTKVNFPKGAGAGIESLDAGMTIGVTTSTSGSVTDIWVLGPPR